MVSKISFMVVTLFHFSNARSHTGFNYDISLISLIPEQTLYFLLDFMTLTFFEKVRLPVVFRMSQNLDLIVFSLGDSGRFRLVNLLNRKLQR